MRLLTTESLLAALEERLDVADSVDIAVAWASPSLALTALHKAANRGVKIRFVVGLDGNATDPNALRVLQECSDLRIANGANKLFHPKCYIFRCTDKPAICWVGSANFTSGGFGLNYELVHEFTDTGYVQSWFDQFWAGLHSRAEKRIAAYVDGWKRSQPVRSPLPEESLIDHPSELIREQVPGNWNGYVAALRKCDAYWQHHGGHWTVLGEDDSYLHTIATAGSLFQRKSWRKLSSDEVNILLAYRDEAQGAWGLLGSMRGAGTAKGAFLKEASIRQIVRDALDPALEAESEEEFISAAIDAIHAIGELDGFGPAIATRLITLARPDRGISVNKGSAPALAHLAKLPETTLTTARNYAALLRWIYRQPWYSTPRPNDSFERTIWGMRAALIDSFVYQPVNNGGD